MIGEQPEANISKNPQKIVFLIKAHTHRSATVFTLTTGPIPELPEIIPPPTLQHLVFKQRAGVVTTCLNSVDIH